MKLHTLLTIFTVQGGTLTLAALGASTSVFRRRDIRDRYRLVSLAVLCLARIGVIRQRIYTRR